MIEDIVDRESAEVRWKAIRGAVVGNSDGSTEGDGENAVCIMGFDDIVCTGSSTMRLVEVHLQSAVGGLGRHVVGWCCVFSGSVMLLDLLGLQGAKLVQMDVLE